MATTGLCRSCGAVLPPDARFCHLCARPVEIPSSAAEFKQVSVVFADVVSSMDIAASVGPERLREIMSRLVDLTGAVVARYGGTVDKFTGDGIMALFGAPVALEDHALRACRASLDIQGAVQSLAADGWVGPEVTLSRLDTLLARAHNDHDRYIDCRDRYREVAKHLDYQGHIEWADALP